MHRLYLLFLFFPWMNAWSCQPSIETLADFIAKVKVIGISDKYEYAFIAEVMDVIYLSPEKENSGIKKGYAFTLSQTDKVIEKRKEGQRKINRVTFDGCEKDYKISNVYRLYARQIDDEIYSGNFFWTRQLEEQ